MLKIILPLVFLLLSALPAASLPSYTFTRFSESMGVPTTTVEKIIQDDNGYLWLATWQGLYSFDGTTFTEYRITSAEADIHDTPASRIVDMHTDDHGQIILLSSRNVLYRINPWTGRTVILTEAQITAIYKLGPGRFMFTAGDGRIYSSNFDRLDQECRLVESFRIAERETVNGIFMDSGENVWIMSSEGLYLNMIKVNSNPFFCCGEKGDSLYFGSTYGRIFSIDAQGGLEQYSIATKDTIVMIANIPGSADEYLAGTSGGAIYRYDFKSRNARRVRCNSYRDGKWQAFGDRYGNLWIYSDRGSLNWYDKERLRVLPFYNRNLQDYWSAGTFINAFFIDNQSHLWISGSWGGLERAIRNSGDFKLKKLNGSRNALPEENNVRAVFQDSKGIIYAATRDGIVHLLDRNLDELGRWEVSETVHDIEETDDGKIWLGTENGGLIENASSDWDRTIYSPVQYTKDELFYGPASDNIHDLLKTGADRLWIASFNQSVSYLDLSDDERRFISKRNLIAFPTDKVNTVRKLAMSPDGRLYGCGSLGIFVCSNPHGSPEEMVFSWISAVREYDIQHIMFSADGRLWSSTSGNGFVCFDSSRSDHRVSFYSTQDGLMSNFVLNSVEDGNGDIWIASNGGLNKFDVRAGIITGYSYEMIGQEVQFNEGTPLLADDGSIYFNTDSGLLHFIPDSIYNRSYVPKMVITSLTCSGKRIPTENTSQIRVRRDDEININFTAIDLTAPERVRYSYRLEGRDRHDIPLGTRSYLNLNNLSPGRYTLYLSSTNADGVIVHNDISLEILVTPDMTVLITATVLIVMGIVCFLVRRKRVSQSPGGSPAAEDEELRDFKENLTEFISGRLDDGELCVAQMAGAMNMSRSSLFEKCRAAIGMTPNEYLRMLRFAKAEEMLSSSTQPISQIAYATGFNDSHYFSKSFKQRYGMTPSEYRKQQTRPKTPTSEKSPSSEKNSQ